MSSVVYTPKVKGFPIAGSDEMMGKPQNVMPHRGLDSNAYAEWIEVQDPRFSAALQALESHITHANCVEFEKSLDNSLRRFAAYCHKKNICHFVCLVEPGKSQKWISEIALQKGIKAAAFVRLGLEGANCLPCSLEEGEFSRKDSRFKHIVIMDDGSFSGNQMTNNVSRAYETISHWFDHPPEFHIVVPYLTLAANRKIHETLKKKGVPFNVYTDNTMETIAEACPKYISELGEVFWPHLDRKEQIEKVHSTALTFFDHKIPNSMSFPAVLAEGPFLSPIYPPYKDEEHF